ncbi:MAG: hypothetical protein C0600_01845 [Ignavibacteria bacterium]|nr:MAG: hypothetical protein C0600_01845 [Ignavibacteria bacterium]
MKTEELTLTRKERERQHKRQDIVEAARHVFAMRGFATATLDEIAERAEFGKATLYNYFQSKEELFELVIADAVDEFMEIATETCLDESLSLHESYTRFTRQLLGHLMANWSIYGLVMRELHKMETNPHIATLMPEFVIILAGPLERAIEKGEVHPLPAPHVAMMFMTMVLSLFKSTLHIQHPELLTSADKLATLDSEVIEAAIEQGLCILERTFFQGIYSGEPTEEKHWCLAK